MVNAYDKFQRTTTIVPWQFPFVANLICDIEERGGNYYAAVTDAYTFQRSDPVIVWTSDERTPEACFIFDGHSYIFFRNQKTNRTEVLKNRASRSYKFPAYRLLTFDSLLPGLYLLDDSNRLKILDIHKMWESNDSSSSSFLTDSDIKLEAGARIKILDLLIIADEVWYISVDDGLALDYKKDERLVRTPNNKNVLTVMNKQQQIKSKISTNLSQFDFIPVSMSVEFDGGGDGGSELRRAGSFPMTVEIPKRPENVNNIWLVALYLIDIVFFLLLIYFLRLRQIGTFLSDSAHNNNYKRTMVKL
jgi:hypothetical protein